MEQELLGDYKIISKLGVGSLGETFLTEHRFLGKRFVVKLLDSAYARDTALLLRLEQEGSRLASIHHPSLAKIRNFAQLGSKMLVVTEPIDAIEGWDPSEPELASIAVQVASGLDALHSVGLVHGALKPSNLLIAAGEEGTRPMLLDAALWPLLGVQSCLGRIYQAIIRSVGDPEEVEKEANKSFLASFAYLSPELKATGSFTPAVDSFALGVLLYQLLTRRLPQGWFPLPSKVRPELKGNWDLLIYHLMQADPAKRPNSLESFVQETLHGTSETPEQLQQFGEAPQSQKALSDISLRMPQGAIAHATALPYAPPVEAAAVKQGSYRPVLQERELKRPEYEADPSRVFQIDTSVARYQPAKIENRSIEPILGEMIIVPGNSYVRGSKEGARDEKPRHPVQLSPYAIDTHPVTNEQFLRFLEAMGGEKDANNNDIIRLRDSRIRRVGGRLAIESGYSRHPVVGVTWYGAVAYARWVGKRLPTEAEWEVAAAAGGEDLYPTGQNIERSQANFFSSDTTPVGSYPSNAFGLYDMAGNVYEWCEDWYGYNYYEVSLQEPLDPKGPAQGVYRVLRGGCWKSSKEDLRCAHRHRNNPGTMTPTYGFRCAADAAAAET